MTFKQAMENWVPEQIKNTINYVVRHIVSHFIYIIYFKFSLQYI